MPISNLQLGRVRQSEFPSSYTLWPGSATGRPRSAVPAWHLISAWIAALPLLYLAMGATLIPETQEVAFRPTQMDDGSPAHRLPLVLVVLICSWFLFTRHSQLLEACRQMKIMVAVPILAVLSTLWSSIPGHTLMSSVILLVFTCFAVYLSAVYTPRRQLEYITIAGVVAVSLSFLAAAIVPGIVASGTGWRGILGHKQNCAAVTTFFLVTAMHWVPRGNLYRIARGVYMALCLLLIGLSQSRIGWALCLLALTLSISLQFLQRMRWKEILFVVLLVTPIVLGAAYGIYGYSSDILQAVGKDPTLSQRTVIWGAAFDSLLQHPFLGYGYAAFWQGMSGPGLNIVLIAGWELQQAQDGYLDLGLQLGGCGLLLLFSLIVQAGINAVRSFKRGSDKRFIRWCVVIIICTLFYDIGESSLFAQRFTWFLFVLACIGLQRQAQAVDAGTGTSVPDHQ